MRKREKKRNTCYKCLLCHFDNKKKKKCFIITTETIQFGVIELSSKMPL